MTDDTHEVVQCAGTTDDGMSCERTMTVHVFRAKRDHYCYDHDPDGDGR